MPNKSMDVRAKQLLCYDGLSLTRSCAVTVSPHVISTVRCFVVNSAFSDEIKYNLKYADGLKI